MGFDTQKKGGGFRERGDCKNYVNFKEKKRLYKIREIPIQCLNGICWNNLCEWELLPDISITRSHMILLYIKHEQLETSLATPPFKGAQSSMYFYPEILKQTLPLPTCYHLSKVICTACSYLFSSQRAVQCKGLFQSSFIPHTSYCMSQSKEHRASQEKSCLTYPLKKKKKSKSNRCRFWANERRIHAISTSTKKLKSQWLKKGFVLQ